MFCFQCEQTSKGEGCTKIGVCGKQPEVAALQDLLVYATKGLSQYAVEGRKVGVAQGKAFHGDLFAFVIILGQPDRRILVEDLRQLVEVQGTGEESTFSEKQLNALLGLARHGIAELTTLQQKALAKRWPFD